MKRILVTGGAGFIGGHLVEALVAAGNVVRVLDDFSTGSPDNLAAVADRIEVRDGSLVDAAAVDEAVAGCELVFHLGALPSVARSVQDPAATHAVCATGTLHVLDAARRFGVRRLVYAASSSAYGDTPGILRREDDPVAPLSPYAAAKLAGEFYCRSFHRVYGLETVRLRFFNIFGPRQNPHSPYTGVIALFTACMSRGEPPRIEGDGLQSRDFTYVANAVQGMMRAAEAPGLAGKVFNLGAGGSTDLLELVRQLNSILGTNLDPVHGPPRPGDVRHSQADITLARREMGYEPAVSFTEGLRRTVAWYQTLGG